MSKRKGVAKFLLSLMVFSSLVAGLLLLSLSGGEYSLTGGDSTDIGSEVDLPEGSGSILGEKTRNAASESGIVNNVAKTLYETLSGRKASSPTDRNRERNKSLGGTNETRAPDEGENESSEGGGKDGGSSGDNSTQDNESSGGGGKDNKTYPDNITDSPIINQSQDIKSSSGFLSGLMEHFSQIFGSNNSSTEREGSETSTDKIEDSQGSSTSQKDQSYISKLSEISSYILMVLALFVVFIIALIVYMVDLDSKEFLKIIIERIKDFMISLPDLFSRVLVLSVDFVINKLKGFLAFLKSLFQSPVYALQKLKESILTKINIILEYIKEVRRKSLKQNLGMVSSQESYEGIDAIWHRLKRNLDLQNQSITPAEVGEKAIEEGISSEAVIRLVEAFRREKYTFKGFNGSIDFSEIDQELEAEEDE